MDLLKCREIGIKWCAELKEEWIKDGIRFTKPIKREEDQKLLVWYPENQDFNTRQDPRTAGHQRSDKSTFMTNREYIIDTVGPVEVDMCISDAGFLIRSQVNLPSTDGGLHQQNWVGSLV